MQMLPMGVVQSLASPGTVDGNIKNFIIASGYKIDNDKTIAGTAYYHDQQPAATVSEVKFFTGTLVSQQTNMPGNNFIRPQSEHQIIYGVRFFNYVGTDQNYDWTPGPTEWMKNCTMTIRSNSVVMVKDYPLSESLENLTVREDGVIPLAVPFVWGGQEAFELVITNKYGQNVPINTNIRATLIAVGLV